MKRVKKRFVFLAAFILMMIVAVLSFVLINGRTFTLKPPQFLYGAIAEMYGYSVEVSDEDVVRIDRTFIEDNIICADLTSVGTGTATVTVKAGDITYKAAEIKVDVFGVIYDTERLSFNGYVLAEWAIIICLLAVAAVMIASYIGAYRKAEFSYSMVAYGGTALFSLALAVYTAYRLPWMNTFRIFLMNVTETGFYFLVVSTPLIMAVSVAFAVSNIWLLRHEGFRPVNMLGIAIGVFWFVSIFSIFVGRTSGIIRLSYDLIDMFFLGAAYFVSFMECVFLSIMVTSFFATRFRPPYNKDYLIILGCGIRKDGSLTPLLRGRADAALSFEREQFAETGRHAKFVPSGGQGSDEIISESEAIKRYLLEQGVPEEMIVKEDKSVNTSQNIEFSRKVIEKDAGTLDGVKSAFATTNYHIFRGYILSKKHNLDAQGLPAKTKWYFFPNAFLRELAGIIVEKKLQFALIALLITAVFALLKWIID